MSTPVVGINHLESILGSLELECAICHKPIARESFEQGEVFAMTGPKRSVGAHVEHFFESGSPTEQYRHNMRLLASAYARANDLQKLQKAEPGS